MSNCDEPYAPRPRPGVDRKVVSQPIDVHVEALGIVLGRDECSTSCEEAAPGAVLVAVVR
ncbi:MAG: hypothetical protein JWN05_3017 [Arthrobacter sp.]|jgi:hypothetical protein|nr:hypothetical protein [Arthrobacter sp.]